MKLRSGFIKNIDGSTCRKCNEFYGYKKFNWLCSNCSGIHKYMLPWRDDAFKTKVNNWAKDKISKVNKRYVKIIKRSIEIESMKSNTTKFKNTEDLIIDIKYCIEKEKDNNLWISAKEGAEILRKCGKDCSEKSHIICPLILDWWNMINYRYNSYELCYYCCFGDETAIAYKIKTIPPPLPTKKF
jgi:hypothetical protein